MYLRTWPSYSDEISDIGYFFGLFERDYAIDFSSEDARLSNGLASENASLISSGASEPLPGAGRLNIRVEMHAWVPGSSTFLILKIRRSTKTLMRTSLSLRG
jgi:hypothetical protein